MMGNTIQWYEVTILKHKIIVENYIIFFIVKESYFILHVKFQKFRGPVHRNLFRGVINDLKTRFPHYLSDFTDGLNGQCVAATIFIYFAALSGAVAFGGLMGKMK